MFEGAIVRLPVGRVKMLHERLGRVGLLPGQRGGKQERDHSLPIASNCFHSSSRTGVTLSRDWRSISSFASLGSALMSARVTGFASFSRGSTRTLAQIASPLALGSPSGCQARVISITPTAALSLCE